MRTILIAIALLFFLGASALAQTDEEKRIAALWKKGSEWQVGTAEHIKAVGDARKALIAAGEPALKHALTRLGTTDGLEIRCLDDVLLGMKAFEPLTKRIGDDDVNVRRNVARILGSFNIRKDEDDKAGLSVDEIVDIAGKLLIRFHNETDPSARYWQLTGPTRWKIGPALGALFDLTYEANERVRFRSISLFAYYLHLADTAHRLLELLDDKAYFVRDAAAEQLKKTGAHGASSCDKHARVLAEKKSLTPAEVRRLRLLIGILAANPRVGSPGDGYNKPPDISAYLSWNLMVSLLSHAEADVRGDAYTAIADLALLKEVSQPFNIGPTNARKLLEDRRKRERDLYALSRLEAALQRME